MNEAAVIQNRDRKLSQALIDERRLATIFTSATIEKVELKSESWLWEQTGNICIEFRCDGRPSGISTTEADVWVHELKRDGETLVYLMFPIERLKELCRDAIRAGRWRAGGGDDGRFDLVILRLREILR
jgi:hypothetical protein